MPRFKKGVEFDSMHSALLAILPEVDEIFLKRAGRRAIITSAREGKHKVGSKHYQGRAIDLRTRDLTGPTVQEIVADLKRRFDDFFDIVLESTHIHLEYDPKG